jgi:hypothetical protein
MIQFADAIGRPTGVLHLMVRQGGLLIEDSRDHNIVVNNSKPTLASLIGGSVANNSVTQMGFGIGTGAASATNSSLTSAYRKAFDSVSYPAVGQVQFSFSLASTEDNGAAISEFGLLTAGNVLFARKVRSAPLNKASDISLSGTWTITF